MLETGSLLEGVRSGDAAAKDTLFERYRGPLERLLHARLPAHARPLLETQDLIQEVVLRAIGSLERFEYRGVGSFWAFLRTIGQRYLADVYRRGSRESETLSDSSHHAPADDPPPSAVAEQREQIERYDRAVEALPVRERQSVALRLELGLDYETISSECGYPSPDAARMAIARALRAVAARMGEGP